MPKLKRAQIVVKTVFIREPDKGSHSVPGGMGLVLVGDRATCFWGGGHHHQSSHVSQGKIFLFSALIEIKKKELPDCSQLI